MNSTTILDICSMSTGQVHHPQFSNVGQRIKYQFSFKKKKEELNINGNKNPDNDNCTLKICQWQVELFCRRALQSLHIIQSQTRLGVIP